MCWWGEKVVTLLCLNVHNYGIVGKDRLAVARGCGPKAVVTSKSDAPGWLLQAKVEDVLKIGVPFVASNRIRRVRGGD